MILYVIDCKHLKGRYDMMNQRNDYKNFTEPKGFNEKVSNKVHFIRENLEKVSEHFNIKYGTNTFDFTEYHVKGAFIINTHTFYMYNSDIRIYSVDDGIRLMIGKDKDPVFAIKNKSHQGSTVLKITQPYFRVPKVCD